MQTNDSLAADAIGGDDTVLWGAESIGAALNLTARQAFHLLERGHLPATKIGGRWASTKRKLLARVHQ
jgi:hypothetical protein